jgi:hypothetical protein
MKSLLRIAFVVCLLVWTFESESQAVPIEVAFTGFINEVQDPAPFGIVIGTPFSGTYVFDSVGTIAIGGPNPDQEGVYQPNGSISAVVGGFAFSTALLSIVLLDQPTRGDKWFTFNFGGQSFGPGVIFGDTTGLRISDVTDYFVNTSLVGWDLHDFVLSTIDPITLQTTEHARGSITSLQIVPEPSIALLFGLGLAGLALRRD